MKKIISITLVLSLTACAAVGKKYQPLVDLQGQDMSRYQANLKQCQDYAGHIDAGKSALVGVLLGGLLGAAVGASFGSRSFMRYGASYGAVAGGGGAGAGAQRTQEQIIMRCLQGRGYSVLN